MSSQSKSSQVGLDKPMTGSEKLMMENRNKNTKIKRKNYKLSTLPISSSPMRKYQISCVNLLDFYLIIYFLFYVILKQ